MRPLPRRPRRRRDPRRAAGRRPLAPPAAVPRHDEPLLRRPQREQARRHARPRGAGRSRAPAGAARVGGHLDRDDAAGVAGGAGARPRRRARAQPGARDHVDHRLRPDRRLPRLGRQRRGPRGHERHPQPVRAWPGATRCARRRGMAYETTAIQAAWATLVAYWNRLETGRGDHVDFSILEAATQTMDPAYGAASVSRASAFPVDARASGGRPLPDLPVRGRLRARRRAGAAPVARDAGVARRAGGLPGRALRRDPGAARGVGRAPRRSTPRCSPA